MAKRWRIHPHDPDRIAALGRAAGIPAVVAQLLICRGITDPASARTFLDPRLSALRDPQLLPGCTEAVRRIHDAVAAGRRIVVYGDYNVNGVTGTAILWLCLKMLGAEVTYYIPHRVEEGYGLHADAVRAFGGGDGGNEGGEGVNGGRKADLLVTVDCGIGCVEEAALARRLGLDLIITDHHEPGLCLPDAAVIVHPRLPGSVYPFGGLSGSGVAFKLAWALCQQAAGRGRSARRCATSCSRPSDWRRWGRWPTWCRWSMRTASWFITAWKAWPRVRRWGWPR